MKTKTISSALTVMAVAVIAAPVASVVFALLRLCDVISWSWWIVTMPLWSTALILLCVVAATVLFFFAARMVINYKTSRNSNFNH